MGGVFIGQESSPFTPAVCRHRNAFHMVFVAANETGDLLHAVSGDGVTWTRRNNVRQSTNAAPAIASLNDTLRVVFVANNSTHELLQSTFDDGFDVWTDNTRLNTFRESVRRSKSWGAACSSTSCPILSWPWRTSRSRICAHKGKIVLTMG